jgi:hypothetical protein
MAALRPYHSVLEEYFGQTCVGDAGNGAFGVFFANSIPICSQSITKNGA